MVSRRFVFSRIKGGNHGVYILYRKYIGKCASEAWSLKEFAGVCVSVAFKPEESEERAYSREHPRL